MDKFLITQNSLSYISSLFILFFGIFFNFAICGLFSKFSAKISNFMSVVFLILTIVFQIPVIGGFLNPYSLESLNFLNSAVILGKSGILYCLIFNCTALLSYLISLKHFRALRHKTHYFNALFLILSLCANILLLAGDLTTFILALEAFCLAFLFIVCAFKNKKILFYGVKYALFSMFASALMIAALALSNCFTSNNDVLNGISQIIFLLGFIAKGGFVIFLSQIKTDENDWNYPAFTYINSAGFVVFTLGCLKIIENFSDKGMVSNLILIFVLAFSAAICGLKMLRETKFKNFISSVCAINFASICIMFLLIDAKGYTGGVFTIICSTLGILTLLSTGAILNYNKKSAMTLEDFKGICITNPNYCALINAAILINAGVIPSGIIAARMCFLLTLVNCGIWTTIVMIFITLGWIFTLAASIKFLSYLNKKPSGVKNLKTIALKKRTKLNYFILFMLIVLLIAMCFFNSGLINLITSSHVY